MLAGAGAGAAALALAACAPGGSGEPTPAEDISDTDKTLTWANWPAYLDEDDDGNYPTLERFSEETGIEVDYQRRRRRQQHLLREGQGPARARAGHRRRHRLPHRLDGRPPRSASATPRSSTTPTSRTRRTSTPTCSNLDFDPGREQSLPWQGGFAGICWNNEKIPDGLAHASTTSGSPTLKGRVGVLSEMRDTMGLIMLEQGVDISRRLRRRRVQRGARRLPRAGHERPDPQHQGQLVHRGPRQRRHPRGDRAGRATSRVAQRRGRLREVGVRAPRGRRHALERQLPRSRSARRARRTPRRSSTTTTSPRSPPRSPPG